MSYRPDLHTDAHDQWDAGGYCNNLVTDDDGTGTVCGYQKTRDVAPDEVVTDHDGDILLFVRGEEKRKVVLVAKDYGRKFHGKVELLLDDAARLKMAQMLLQEPRKKDSFTLDVGDNVAVRPTEGFAAALSPGGITLHLSLLQADQRTFESDSLILSKTEAVELASRLLDAAKEK